MNTSIHSHSKTALNDLLAAKRAWSSRCFGAPRASGFRAFSVVAPPTPDQNVVGVGIGEKLDGGKPTGILAVKFFVRRKFPEGEISPGDMLPKSIDGLPVDVEEAGFLRALARQPRKPRTPRKPREQPAARMPDPKAKWRPARPGSSCGFRAPGDAFRMAGTFGALVRDSSGAYILSNNHVLADENNLAPGAPIFQPGLLDRGNVATDQVAALTRFIRLQLTGTNKVDAAIAKGTRAAILSRDILHLGPPSGTAAAAIDMRVHKFGRTTSYTVGRVTSTATDVTVGYNMGNLFFEDQIVIVGDQGSFSAGGDSGSLILDRTTNKAVGLLFAGSATHTIANHIADVLGALKVTLA